MSVGHARLMGKLLSEQCFVSAIFPVGFGICLVIVR